MKVDFSKEFIKALDRLSGKIHKSVVDAINEVIDVESIDKISNCKRLKPSIMYIE